MLPQVDEGLRGLFEIKHLRLAFIAGALALLNFRLDVDEQAGPAVRFRYSGYLTARGKNATLSDALPHR
ncbi:MAG: hypothetical protein LBL45_10480, partial [Treponema sp.]|nr:hypothetical protein [Treponema sp.]